MADEPQAKRKCIGVDCSEDAGTLQCPTCLKLEIKDSYFCSQDCFKRSWVRTKFEDTMVVAGGTNAPPLHTVQWLTFCFAEHTQDHAQEG